MDFDDGQPGTPCSSSDRLGTIDYERFETVGGFQHSMIGPKVGHYRIIEKLGEGGMGEVYLAEDTLLGRRVALKVLSQKKTNGPEGVERFKHEARAVAALSHPNIITIHSVEEAEGRYFITMELVEGRTLGELIPITGFQLTRFLTLSIPITEGLRAAHERGIVHRDLKPANIAVSDGGLVKILDFGLARFDLPKQDTDTELITTRPLTLDAQILGTVPYMAPEQLQGKQTDARTDIFSVGVLFHEMATGQHPFSGETVADRISSILRDRPPSVCDLRVDYPKDLGKIILRCLEKEPERRYQAILELHDDLERLQRDVDRGGGTPFVSSIAVLPFADLSPERDQQYFCDGIAEELITALTRIKDLRVVARTSAFSCRDKGMDVKQIGNVLGVAAVLEGSVRTAGNRVRITSQLVATEDGYQLWSDKFDREMDDVFSIQDEIARRITERLKVKLVVDSGALFVRKHTKVVDAYNFYLKGRYHWALRSESGIRKGIEFFDQSIALDPDYAPALAGLADCHTQLGDYGYMPPGNARMAARAPVLRALEIDDTLAEAHTSLAYMTLLYDWDWNSAEREFKRALELNPSYATTHQLYAEYLTAMGRMDEAIAEVLRARELDPVSLIVNTVAGWVFFRARHNGRAAEQCLNVLEQDSGFALAHNLLSWVYVQQGKHDEAVAEARQGVALSEHGTLMTATLGYALALSGDSDGARTVLEAMKNESSDRYVPPYDLALVHTGLGQNDQALTCLEKACDERYGWLVYLNADPIWDSLRSEPRFSTLVQRVGLPKRG